MHIVRFIVALSIMIMLFAVPVHAGKLAGKNVLLIQGYLPNHTFVAPSDGGKKDGINYWNTFKINNNGYGNSDGLRDPNVRILYYPSSNRIEEPSAPATGIGKRVAAQLKDIFQQSPDFCKDGCVVVTHSTGDLVMRYVLKNASSLLGTTYAPKLKIVAFVDMAGAGGGTEGASVLYTFATTGKLIMNATLQNLVDWVFKMLGIDLNSQRMLNAGVLYDLQPSVARNTATTGIPAIPRLRIAGAGDELYGVVTKLFILGKNDSVVPLHSACGASSAAAYDSCTTDLRIDGRVMTGVKGPTTYYSYHYPIIMSEKMPHNDMFKQLGWDYTLIHQPYYWNTEGRDMTFALSGAQRYANNTLVNHTVKVGVEYEKVYAWWDWYREYRFVTNANQKSMGQVILDSFEL